MKKIILFITAILIGLTSFAQMGSIPVSPGYGGLKAAEFQQRVIDSSGTYLPNVAPHEFDVLRSYGIDPVFALFPASQSSGAVMAHIPTDGTGDGTMARNSTSYNVNYNGYLEPIAVNTLAVDYSNGIPYFETHEQRTNLITYPKSLGNSYWTKSGATIEGDASTAGADLLSGWDFTSGWSPVSAVTIDDANSFTAATTNDGILKTSLTEVGKTYRCIIAGTTTSDDFTIRNEDRTEIYKSAGSTGAFSLDFYFYNTSTTGISLINTTAGTTDITTLELYEVTGYSTPLLDAGTPTTEAYKLVEDGTTGQHVVFSGAITVVNGNNYTATAFVKAGERDIVVLGNFNGDNARFNLTTGVIESLGNCDDATITPVVNGWYRISATYDAVGTGERLYLYLYNGGLNYTGDGTSGVYLCYPQLEEGSYASPLMLPATEGSTTTRLKDEVTGFGDAATFSGVNSSGVLYAEIAAHSNDLSLRFITLGDGTSSNFVRFRYTNVSNAIEYTVKVGGVNQANSFTAISDVTDYSKVAVRWAVNDFSLWINGVEVLTDVSGSIFPASTLNELQFNDGDGSGFEFNAKTKSVMVLNYLDDTNMQILTTP